MEEETLITIFGLIVQKMVPSQHGLTRHMMSTVQPSATDSLGKGFVYV